MTRQLIETINNYNERKKSNALPRYFIDYEYINDDGISIKETKEISDYIYKRFEESPSINLKIEPKEIIEEDKYNRLLKNSLHAYVRQPVYY